MSTAPLQSNLLEAPPRIITFSGRNRNHGMFPQICENAEVFDQHRLFDKHRMETFELLDENAGHRLVKPVHENPRQFRNPCRAHRGSHPTLSSTASSLE